MQLSVIAHLLQAMLADERTNTLDIAVHDGQGREMLLEKFPVTGSKRALAYRTGNGADALAVPTTGALVLPANEARIGGRIVNSGANAVILYLSGAGKAQAGAPAIWLAASGGTWDMRLGNVLWCGNISAVAQVGASTLAVAEV